MVAVATSLAHDGIASPVASLEDNGRKASYGVQMPIAVVVDLDYVRRSEPAMRRGGIGDAISNLSAIADWRLAERERGEAVDGVAVTFARTAATSILHRDDGDRRRRVPDRAGRGARAVRAGDGDRGLVAAVQRRRPRDPPRDRPPVPRHRRTRRARGRRLAVHRVPARRGRACAPGSTPACAATGCRAPRRPRALPEEQFAAAVVHAPPTRGRTATRSSSTSRSTRRGRASASARSPRSPAMSPAIPELRAATQPAVPLRAQQRRALGRPALHAPPLAVRHAAAAAHAAHAERRHLADDRRRAWRRPRCSPCRDCRAAIGVAAAAPAPDAARLLATARSRAGASVSSPTGIYLDRLAPLRHRDGASDRARRARGRRLGLARRLHRRSGC